MLYFLQGNYREFLQNLLIYELINFKLPWIDAENQGEGNSGLGTVRSSQFEDAVVRRQQKITRIQQMEQMEKALDKLRLEEKRDNDESAQVFIYICNLLGRICDFYF